MKFLLDTHAFLWWLADDDKLGRQARKWVEDPANDILISMVSLWEIALKVRIGKLEADTKEIANIIQRDGFTLLDMSLKHILALRELPIHHRDPFDHLLMAQAITEDATFLSEDRNAARYPVRTVGCSG